MKRFVWWRQFWCWHSWVARPPENSVDHLFYVAHQKIELGNPFKWPAIFERYRCVKCGKETYR